MCVGEKKIVWLSSAWIISGIISRDRVDVLQFITAISIVSTCSSATFAIVFERFNMKSVVLLAIVGLFGQSSVEAFGAASTSNVRVNRASANLEMKIFDWKARDAFENYIVPDGTSSSFVDMFLISHVVLIFYDF